MPAEMIVAGGIARMNLLASSTCTRDWIEISASSEECNGNQHFNRYCGFRLSTEIASDRTLDKDPPYTKCTNGKMDTLPSLSELDLENRRHRTICDCTLPFNVGVRTSRERIPTDTISQPINIAMIGLIDGQKWDQEENDP